MGSMADAFKKAYATKGDDGELRRIERVEEQRRALEQERQRLLGLNERTKDLLLLPHLRVGGEGFANAAESGFVNPYNFFPLEQVGPERRPTRRGTLTGRLTCTLEVQGWSPLFVPNTSGVFTSGNGEKLHRSFDFYSHDDLTEQAKDFDAPLPTMPPSEPRIPGSELRGMVRSVYEQLTNSCLSVIGADGNPIKRTNVPKTAYRMEYDKATKRWQLFKTEVYRLGRPHHDKSFTYTDARGRNYPGSGKIAGKHAVDYLKGEYVRGAKAKEPKPYRVAIDPASCTKERWGTTYVPTIGVVGFTAGAIDCRLHVTGDMFNKHLTLYPDANLDTGSPKCSFTEGSDLFARFLRVLDAYCTEQTSKNHNDAIPYYEAYKALIDAHETVLVYADDGANPNYLSPSCLSPESFDTAVTTLLGDHAPCSGPSFCPACNLFGTIGDNASRGSRVRFGEARLAPDSSASWLPWTTLAPLSTPRPSATEFYLKRPNLKDANGKDLQGLWNVDYLQHLQCADDNGRDRRVVKAEARYRDMPGTGIQGRKVYLHAPFDLRAHYADAQLEPTGQNVTVRPMSGGTFTFDVFFERLTEGELANLAFAIGGMGEGRLQKLGHGRPLGMGSVLVKVVACETKSYEYVDGRIRAGSGTLDAAWMEGHLPADDRATARRRLVRFFARDLREIPYAGAGGDTLGDIVSYPKAEGKIGETHTIRVKGRDRRWENAIFEWFGKNRGSVREPKIVNTLETLSVEDVMDKEWQQLP